MVTTHTFTATTTRTEALLDQVGVFLQYAGIGAAKQDRILPAVNRREIEAVGVYRTNAQERRTEEIEFRISWSRHLDQASIQPVFSTDLPGWDQGAAPEVLVMARRFGQSGGASPRFWVRFVPSVRQNPTKHRQLCDEVGVRFGSSPPQWLTRPSERSLTVQDMDEASVHGRTTY